MSEEGGEAQLQILRLFDPLLARAELIKHDHAALSGGAAFDEPSPKTQEYLDILEDDAAGDVRDSAVSRWLLVTALSSRL